MAEVWICPCNSKRSESRMIQDPQSSSLFEISGHCFIHSVLCLLSSPTHLEALRAQTQAFPNWGRIAHNVTKRNDMAWHFTGVYLLPGFLFILLLFLQLFLRNWQVKQFLSFSVKQPCALMFCSPQMSNKDGKPVPVSFPVPVKIHPNSGNWKIWEFEACTCSEICLTRSFSLLRLKSCSITEHAWGSHNLLHVIVQYKHGTRHSMQAWAGTCF